jgi:FAD/FMN-containing dehydrogenase/Fe-S oxidoreductase
MAPIQRWWLLPPPALESHPTPAAAARQPANAVTPPPAMKPPPFGQLAARLAGELHTDSTHRRLYATDASEYQELPAAVVFPQTEADLREIIRFANSHAVGLIPRTAGTSLAGQVVGHGLVIDFGRHFNRIIGIDAGTRRVRVQPGVVRNELNHALAPLGLLFCPETSTANRAMIGGMVGNNSCGANSIIYGSVRDHLVSCRGLLSDGSEVTFGPLTPEQFAAKCAGDSLEAHIYQTVRGMLGEAANRRAITAGFPKKSVTRRNTGYALDVLMEASVFDPACATPFNFCRLLAGSEGTLFMAVEFELNCEPLPPPGALMCAHFQSIDEALHATLLAMELEHRPAAVELIDRHILECTKQSPEHRRNRDFVQGDPGAILVVEIRDADQTAVDDVLGLLEARMRDAGLGYAWPVLRGADSNKVWELRRAGQGLMSNVRGDAKPREIVEDTAVDVRELPAYIAEFDALMRDKHGLACVYYAHAGAGELHTRPLFNLKTQDGLRLFREVATDVAALVKKYRGSLSGEHGDGRLRGEFIPFMVGPQCHAMMRAVKLAFDPHGIFNPGKIIDTPPMDTSLRHQPGHPTPDYATTFDFSAVQGITRAAEKCNGSGDCRKSHLAGGTMCPSYQATRDEKDSTRGRANMLRHVLTDPPDPTRPFDSDELAAVLDLCLSCKACKAECPSTVDMAKLKAEVMQQRHDSRGAPLRSRMIAAFPQLLRLAAWAPWAWNAVFATPPLRRLANRICGFHPDRTIPRLHPTTLRKWFARRPRRRQPAPNGTVHLFCDEFTDSFDVPVGIAAVELLEGLGYAVVIPPHVESGRSALSKGFLRQARVVARRNVTLLKDVVSATAPLLGIEPSAILAFRDEYPDLLRGGEADDARALARHCLLFDEWFAREMDAGRITAAAFRERRQVVKLHGHCHQKALASLEPTLRMLELPPAQTVDLIPSGCCGMAGAFGYEAEHFAVANAIGELVLFPAIRNCDRATVVVAAGTSCRHQIHDGTGCTALHPVQVMREALADGRG